MNAFTPGNLGNAQGKISIDVRDLRNVQAVARDVGITVERSLGSIDAGAKKAESSFTRLNRSIGSIRGQLLAVGAAGAILTGIGLNVAASMEEARIQIRGMVGNERDAVKLMDDLRKRAAAAGVPFSDMLSVATQLLPTFQGNTKELEKWYDLVRRTATLNRREGVQGAAFAIREALTSGGTDLVSLSERFNISRVQLRTALEQTGGDFAAALDMVLTKMGITTQVADEMGLTFNASLRAARDAAGQLLAEGLTPILNILTPILQSTASWLSQLRETQPAIGNITGAVLVLTATLPPALLLFNQLVEAATKLKALGILGGLGRAGAVGAGAAIGGAAGIGIVRGVGAATGDEYLRTFGLSQFVDGLKRMFISAVNGFHETLNAIDSGLVSAVSSFTSAIAGMVEAMGTFVVQLAQQFPERFRGGLPGLGERILGGAAGVRGLGTGLEEAAAARAGRRAREMGILQRGLFPLSQITGDEGAAAQARVQVEQQAAQARLDAINQWAASVKQLEQDTAAARLDAVQSYNLTLRRDAEDYARGRARQEQQLADQIADIRSDAAERESEWQADFVERIADIRADGNERLTDLETKYNRDREKAAHSHRDRLMDAASRLDAVAVFQEQRRYAAETRDRDEAFKDQRNDIEKQLAERIAQEQEAHEERLNAARKADEERIIELQDNLAEQQRMEDEDRAIRLQRMAEDQQQRLTQLATQAARERAALDAALTAQLATQGDYYAKLLVAQSKHQTESQRMFDEWWEGIKAAFRGAPAGPGGGTGGIQRGDPIAPQPFADGGPVRRTGTALVHAGEYVLNPMTTAMLTSALGGLSQSGLVNATRGGRSITWNGDVSVSIAGSTNMGSGEMYVVARQAFTDALGEIASQ